MRQRETFFATNERFHMALLEIAGNRWALQIVTDLRKVMKLNRHHSLFKQGRIAEALAEHRAMMQALQARDATGAARLMREHFANGLAATSWAELNHRLSESRVSGEERRNLTPWLIIAALFLLPVDVALRRVMTR